LIERRFAPRADLVLTVNDAIARRLTAHAGARAVHVMHNVGEPAAPGPRGDLRRRLGIDDRRPLVVYQGLFREGRGLIELIDAVREIEEATLVLIGEGPMDAEVRARAAGLAPHYFVLPFIPPDELARLTPDADVGAAPIIPITESLALALPNKVFEYAAAGLPILAGAGIEPMRELVERYDAGLAVHPSDHAAMVEALRRLLEPSEAARFRSGADRLTRDFGWDREKERFLAVYSPLLSHDP
jgi:glycosyltransferase involved in cell wall biosynthesis